MPLTDEDVREILRLIDESDLAELRIETQGFSLHVRRDATVDEAEPAPEPELHAPVGAMPHAMPSADGVRTIDAPMPGTFYRAESPGAEPFVDVGTEVEPDTVVGILEVMKMMNSVQAGVSGTIVEICAEDAQLLQEGAPLFRIATA
jgi:acetyl-CoA carboxylase biotin carboxyl carrier protein